MRTSTQQATLAVAIAIVCITALAPVAHADSRQKNKNMWRNGAIAAGAVTLYGLAHHNTTTTLLGAAGTAYTLSRYEQDRKSQSAARRARARAWYRRHHRHYHPAHPMHPMHPVHPMHPMHP